MVYIEIHINIRQEGLKKRRKTSSRTASVCTKSRSKPFQENSQQRYSLKLLFVLSTTLDSETQSRV